MTRHSFKMTRTWVVSALLVAMAVVFLEAVPAEAAGGDAQGLISNANYILPRHKAQLKNLAVKALRSGVPADSVDRLTFVALTRQSSPAALARYYQVLARVASQGLPVLVFENKIEEGIAKNARPEVILAVIGRKEQSYLKARALLANHVPRQQLFSQSYYQVLNLISDSLLRGTPPATVQALLASGAGTLEERGRAILAYGQLVSIGFPAPEGRDIVLAALKNGYYRDCMGCVGQLVAGASRQGMPSARIRDHLVSAMSQRRDLQDVSHLLSSTGD